MDIFSPINRYKILIFFITLKNLFLRKKLAYSSQNLDKVRSSMVLQLTFLWGRGFPQ